MGEEKSAQGAFDIKLYFSYEFPAEKQKSTSCTETFSIHIKLAPNKRIHFCIETCHGHLFFTLLVFLITVMYIDYQQKIKYEQLK